MNWLGLLVVAALASATFAADPPQQGKPKFTLGPGTTVITGPLTDDGYLDYETALNDRLRGTITPQTNAVVELLTAIDIQYEGKYPHADFYKALGIERPPLDGNQLIEHAEFFADELKELKKLDEDDRRPFYDHHDQLRTKPWKPTEAPRYADWLKVNAIPLATIEKATRAHQAELAFVEAARLDAKTARQCQADLLALPPWPRCVDVLDLSERFVILNAIQSFQRNSHDQADDKMKGLDWNLVLRLATTWHDKLIAAATKPTRAEWVAAMTEVDAQFRHELQSTDGHVGTALKFLNRTVHYLSIRAALSEFVGLSLIRQLWPAHLRIQDKTDQVNQLAVNGVLAFALAAYHADHGQYPPTLADLAPRYLKQIPGDVFSGQALIYKRTDTGFLLDSVGVNGLDDGGRSQVDHPQCDDLVVRSPRQN